MYYFFQKQTNVPLQAPVKMVACVWIFSQTLVVNAPQDGMGPLVKKVSESYRASWPRDLIYWLNDNDSTSSLSLYLDNQLHEGWH